jgi:hypothetical protein
MDDWIGAGFRMNSSVMSRWFELAQAELASLMNNVCLWLESIRSKNFHLNRKGELARG